MTDHTKPHGDMNAAQVLALFADDARHPNALNYELVRCKVEVLAALVDGDDTPPALVVRAVDEAARRRAARANLLAALGA